MSRKAPQCERKVVMNITQRELTLVVLEKYPGQVEPSCRHRRLVWRVEALSLQSDDGCRELTVALTRLATDEKLQGVPLHVTLNGDLCVTRVVSGENEMVRNELQELIERSRGYLSLGPGEKVVSTTEVQLDARRRQIWATIASRAVIENIEAAFMAARLTLVRVEHSLTALSHVMQVTGDDSENPVVVIEVALHGVDVGISYKGQLLLDYRPSGQRAKENVSIIVLRHVKRLQRYVDKLLRGASRPIRTICVSGETVEAELVRMQFLGLPDHGEMSMKLIEPRDVTAEWDFYSSTGTDCALTSSIGMLQRLITTEAVSPYPNLLDPIREHRRGPVIRHLVKLGWPMLATVAASLLMGTVALFQNMTCSRMEQSLAVLEEDLGTVKLFQNEVTANEAEVLHLKSIHDALTPPKWRDTLASVGACLPRGVWLRELGAKDDDGITISGTSHSEDGVFEFIRYLRGIPQFGSVALESTQQTVVANGPAVQFSLKVGPGSRQEIASQKDASRQ